MTNSDVIDKLNLESLGIELTDYIILWCQMNTTDIIKNLSKKLGITQKQTREIFKETIDSLKNILVKGDQFLIRDLGSFRVRERAGRKSFIAFIKRWMMIPPRVNVNFRPALKLRKLAKEKSPNE